MTTNFINICFALFSLDPVSLTLLSSCCWKSHTSGLLSWRNWDEALLEEFIRAWWGGYLKRIHPPNTRITVWIRMRDVLLLQKFYQVREFRMWQKDDLLFQQTLFKGVILINNRQESLSCNQPLLYLFNPIDSKHYIVENSISMPQSVTVWCTSGAHFRSLNFVFYLY